VQNLLLGLGTGLLAVAGVVFTAVNWDRLDAGRQAVVLLAATALLAVLTGAAARHRMPATAEALGLVTVLSALVDAHAVRVGGLPAVDTAGYWAVALAGVAATAWGLSLATGVGSARLAAVVLAQAPAPLALAGAGATSTVAELVVLAQVAGVVELVHRARRTRPDVRALAGAVAALTWAGVIGVVATVVASGDWWLDPAPYGPAAVLAAAGGIAVQVAVRRSRDEGIRVLGLLVASLLGAAAAGLAAAVAELGDWWAPAVAGVAVVAVAAGTRAPARWGRIPAGVGASVAVIVSSPLVDAIWVSVDAASRVTGLAWQLAATDRAASFAHHPAGAVDPGALAAHIGLVLALVVAALPVIGRRVALAGLAGGFVAAVLTAPVLLPLDLTGATLGAGGAAVLTAGAAALAGRRKEIRWSAAAVSGGALALTAAWGSATPGLSTLAAAAVAVAAALVAAAGLRTDDGWLALAAGSLAAAAIAVTPGLAVVLGGGSGTTGAAVAAGTAAAVGLLAGLVLDPAGRDGAGARGRLALAVEAAGWLVHGAALAWAAQEGDTGAVAAVLGAGTLAAVAHATRPGRRRLAGLAAAEGLCFVWLQLAVGGVRTAEAYTLPLAVVLLAVGVVADRSAGRSGEPLGSWLTLGPALVVGLAPTGVLAFGDPGLVRPLAGLAAGAVVLAVGAVTARRAPVDVGAAVVVALGLRQLVPVVGQLPNWAVLAATGAFLLALGATFEQRRRELHHARTAYTALR
jgi:hypothetical protein